MPVNGPTLMSIWAEPIGLDRLFKKEKKKKRGHETGGTEKKKWI